MEDGSEDDGVELLEKGSWNPTRGGIAGSSSAHLEITSSDVERCLAEAQPRISWNVGNLSSTGVQSSEVEDLETQEDMVEFLVKVKHLEKLEAPEKAENLDMMEALEKEVEDVEKVENLEKNKPVPDRVLEVVAERLRRIGDEMESDIRRMARSSRSAHPDRTSGHFLLPLPGTPMSRKQLAVIRDLACCEILAPDIGHVTVRRVLVSAGRAFAHALLNEVASIVACPVDFRSKWSTLKWIRWSIS